MVIFILFDIFFIDPSTSNPSSVGGAVKEAMNTLQDNGQDNLDADEIKTEYVDLNGSYRPPSEILSSSSSSSVVHVTGPSASINPAGNLNSNQHGGYSYNSNGNIGPPPPYRTATLVFRLLQIGSYQFRSFSEVNPNRLRVLFNTQ